MTVASKRWFRQAQPPLFYCPPIFFVTINYLAILNQTVYNSRNGRNKISF